MLDILVIAPHPDDEAIGCTAVMLQAIEQKQRVGVVVLVNQLEGNLLQPVLMGRSMKLHAFVILIALTVGTVLGGIIGAVLAVPITAKVPRSTR